MANEVEAKADGDLLEIWAHQTDYMPEIVTRAKAEIQKRNLDTGAIHVVTAEEIEKKNDATRTKSDRRWSRAMAVANLVVALSTVSAFFRGNMYRSGLVVGLLLIIISLGVWMRKKWALISGLILYALVAVMAIVDIVAELTIRRRIGTIGQFDPTEVMVLFVSVFMAVVFNSLRKRAYVDSEG